MSALFIILAFIFKAICDNIKFHWSTSIFNTGQDSWMNPGRWKNVWKNGDPTQGERFFGSSTIFIFLNDGWHFFDVMRNISFICAITFYSSYVPMSHLLIDSILISRFMDTFILFVVGSVLFEIFYSRIFKQ